LWKFSKPGEPSWPSPWGKGRPGWHIEDTAITEKYFGSQYDIHGGARDLIFPHHEAEIAQMEAVSGKKPLVKYWLHTGFLTVRGRKMAKSLGNFITIREFLEKDSVRLLRLLMAKAHYRSPIDYSEEAVAQCRKELARIDEFADKVKSVKTEGQKEKTKPDIAQYEERFEKAMEDDFNTPKALAVVFDLLNKGNALIARDDLSYAGAKNIMDFLKKLDRIFGFVSREKTKEIIPEEIIVLLKERERYRKEKNWQKADEAREEIERKGFRIEDTKEGAKIKKG
jgi:cysteinyl-tRNA synthetase